MQAASSGASRLRAKRSQTEPGGVLDLFGSISPRLYRPDHFSCYAARLEHAVRGGLRIVFAAPPQHGKTEVTLHGLVWIARRFPGLRHAYITYNDRRAQSVARKVKRLLAECGIVPGGTLQCLTLPQGGQILFASIDGGITGEPVDGVAVIDDPVKNRREADSERRREIILDCYREAVEPRVHPGASIIVLATRWHPQDLSGTLIDEGWEYINLTAIAENDDDPNGRAPGEPLFPEMWPIEALETKRAKVLDFTWATLYQGRPRPRGGKVFHEPTWYTRLPEQYRGIYGLDLAYTAKTSADWSICVTLLREERPNRAPLYYVTHVDRAQVEAPEFALTLKARKVQRPHYRMIWRAGGTEKGAAQFLKKSGLPVVVATPPGDKLVCATPAAAAWNGGRILVPDPEAFPESDAWVGPFLDILSNFTGSGKEHDDDVDALGNALDALEAASGGGLFCTIGGHGRSGGRVV